MKRYNAQIRLEEIGRTGQQKLAEARILIVGCGALGSPAAMYLAGAGAGHITIADFDTVELSNLHRQVFYSEEEAGKSKAECLKAGMLRLNSEISVTVWNKLVTSRQLIASEERFDIIIDAADNPATTYMLDRYCFETGIPLSTAGVSGWTAQVFLYCPGSVRYSEIFPEPEEGTEILPCSVAGIAGPVAQFASSLQVADAIKVITGTEKKESRLTTANLLTNKFEVITC